VTKAVTRAVLRRLRDSGEKGGEKVVRDGGRDGDTRATVIGGKYWG